MRRYISFGFCVALLGAAIAVVPSASAGTDPKSHAKKPSDPFLSGEPFTLDQVLLLLKQDAIPLHRRKEAIENRGVAFPLSTDALAKLQSAGAPDDIMDVIKTKAKPLPPPPAPKPVAKGMLNLTCAPVECQVTLNGSSIGATAGGKLEVAGLTPGNWVVDFAKEGYVSHQSTVTVEPAKSSAVAATLSPDRAAREAFGKQLFQKMIKALGGDDGLITMSSVQARGSTTLWGHDGTSVRWTLLMRNRQDRALFQAKTGKILHEVMFDGSEFKASKNLNGEDALQLPTDFGMIRDNQLPALIAHLKGPAYKLIADHTDPVPGEEFSLVAESGTDKVSIGLDADLRPQRVKIATAAGIGSMLITYADYVQNGNTFYPKTMLIKPEGQQQGIEVKFDKLELNPNLKDQDYRLRGKALVDLEN
ncbi:MAG TPA: PEGA domain-containing protein [Bryobacteraceae bacterium]|nr:PEGA domain-containing protein [Bryobacteraceae bacterium]